MRSWRVRAGAIAAMTLGVGWIGGGPAAAHNAKVHREMTRFAFELLSARKSSAGVPSGLFRGRIVMPVPRGVSPADWNQFLSDTTQSAGRLQNRSAPCPKGAEDANNLRGKTAGDNLGDCAAAPDYATDDTHLSVNLASVGGAGALRKIADDAAVGGIGLLLVPFICAADCVGSLLGLGGDCDECVKHAKQIANQAPTSSDLAGLVPGIGDVSGEDYTGLWHFINLTPGVSNLYDDHQGILYEEAGPNRTPGVVDLAIIAATDLAGLSVNYDKSDGVRKYQISSPSDGFPDGDRY